MNRTQKIIKYLAIVFGIFLSISIFSSIAFGISTFFNVFMYIEDSPKKAIDRNDVTINKNYLKEFSKDEISSLDVDISVSNFNVISSDKIKVEGLNIDNTFKCYLKDSKLIISDKEIKFKVNSANNQTINLYIPKDFVFEKVKIETGISSINLANIASDELDIKIGSGVLKADNIVSNNTKIDGGIGKLEIRNSELDNLDLTTGVGITDIEAIVRGKSKVESGIGEVSLKILDEKEEYYFKTQNGIGGIFINGTKVQDGIIGEKTSNLIDVTGGIGKISIDFEKN